ncbi:MAG: hypothetical protein DWQ37_23580 [Planctomycetota bacterium]|nr:MAG: hypothetical protein DWQ37_23580 [Planctomycetota bacterium]
MYCISSRRCRVRYFGHITISSTRHAAQNNISQNHGESVIGGRDGLGEDSGIADPRLEQQNSMQARSQTTRIISAIGLFGGETLLAGHASTSLQSVFVEPRAAACRRG